MGLLSRGLTIERGLTFQYLRYSFCLLFDLFIAQNYQKDIRFSFVKAM